MKYILLNNDTKLSFLGTKLFRVQSIAKFHDVEIGCLGGYIESEENLSHEGSCWVHDGAQVSGSAKIFGSIQILKGARVFGNIDIPDYLYVSGDMWEFN